MAYFCQYWKWAQNGQKLDLFIFLCELLQGDNDLILAKITFWKILVLPKFKKVVQKTKDVPIFFLIHTC